MRCSAILALALAFAATPALGAPTRFAARDASEGDALVARFRHSTEPRPPPQPPIIVTSPSQEHVNIIHVPPRRHHGRADADVYEALLRRRMAMEGYFDELE